MIKLITSGIVDSAELGFLETAAPPVFAPISIILRGPIITKDHEDQFSDKKQL